ncbi:MAG: hypothetical protein EOP06_03855 [Proteobacteria bacterium]|nr:MAG: hypothetical protein EOP06_03855 [Pseudomonadota bacterium]
MSVNRRRGRFTDFKWRWKFVGGLAHRGLRLLYRRLSAEKEKTNDYGSSCDDENEIILHQSTIQIQQPQVSITYYARLWNKSLASRIFKLRSPSQVETAQLNPRKMARVACRC